MHSWFECKISYEKVLENGMQKKVTEPYLVDAISFTEAEARITEEVRPFISGGILLLLTLNVPVFQNCSSTKTATVSTKIKVYFHHTR